MSTPERVSLVFDSTVGRLRVTANRTHLIEVKLRAPAADTVVPDGDAGDLCRRARREIEAYLAGELQEFTVPWRLFDGGFKRRVLEAMAAVPYARTVTYGELARRSGEGVGASQAVGAICGSNPLPLVVPCHRVLAADGLGGFGGGLPMKRWLLRLETTGRPPRALRPDGSEEPADDALVDPLADGVQQSLF